MQMHLRLAPPQLSYRNQWLKASQSQWLCREGRQRMRNFKRVAEKGQVQNSKEQTQNSSNIKRTTYGVNKEVALLVRKVSTQLALVFNRLIYTVNTVSNNIELEQDQRRKKRKQGKETIDLIQIQEQEEQQKKEMKKLKKKFKPYELEYQENKPKKPVSSFFIFYQEKIKELGPKGDSSGPKLSQIVADAWNSLTDEQKRPYMERSNQTKQKYIEEMRQYIEDNAEWIEEAKQEKRNAINKYKGNKSITSNEEIEEQMKSQLDKRFLNRKLKGISLRQMKLEQRKEYSHRPKAPVSSFFIFYKEEAKNISEKYSVNQGKKLAKLASDIWKSMPEQQKKPYDAKAQIEREKYHEEMRQYRIKFPEEVQKRKQKISASMRRYFRKATDEDSIDSSDSDSPDSSQFQQSKSYESIGTSKDDEAPPPKPEKKVQRRDNNLLPNKPRGPVCGFFQYYQKNIKKFMTPGAEHKDHGSDLVRRASNKWKNMTAQQKQPYALMYKADRQRYLKEMEDYKTNHPQEYEIYLKVTNKTKTFNSTKSGPSNTDQPEVTKDDISNDIDSKDIEEDSLGQLGPYNNQEQTKRIQSKEHTESLLNKQAQHIDQLQQ